MNNQIEIAEEIESSIPSLHLALHTPGCRESIYKQVGVLVDYTTDEVCNNEMTEAKRVLGLAEKLYGKGCNSVKHAIENVFVYSFSNLLSKAGQNRQGLMAIIPVTLFTIYMKQVLNHGC